MCDPSGTPSTVSFDPKPPSTVQMDLFPPGLNERAQRLRRLLVAWKKPKSVIGKPLANCQVGQCVHVSGIERIQKKTAPEILPLRPSGPKIEG